MKKIFKLGIGIPSGPDWPKHHAISLLQMMLYLQRAQIPGYSGGTFTKIYNESGSILPQLRHNIVKYALRDSCTHLLFIDSDQTFPYNLVHNLVRHGRRVVGCNIATKSIPSNPTARMHDPAWWGGHMVYSQGRAGLQQVWRLGFGIMLIDTEVFSLVPKPWFEIKYHKELDDYMGEDWDFCEKLEAARIPIYVDHEVSREIGHVGSYTYTHGDIVVPPATEAA